ncbi:MAG: hypothetical protein R3254_05910 [Thiomicrorhabdus sp.]|nr:hypothetical protein [Thiomicrorhabdus sp.]
MEQLDFYKKVIELKEQNPEAQLIIEVNNDQVLSCDEAGTTYHEIEEVRLQEVYVFTFTDYEERFFYDLEDFKDNFECYRDRQPTQDEINRASRLVISAYTQAAEA